MTGTKTSEVTQENALGTKRCSKCGETKSLILFAKQTSSLTGLSSHCKACKVIGATQWVKTNRLRHAVNLARRRARLEGLPFSIKYGDLVVPTACPVLGIPLSFGSDTHIDFSPSLDRINPSLGYVKDNVRVISFRANKCKNNLSLIELYLFCTYHLKLIRDLRLLPALEIHQLND